MDAKTIHEALTEAITVVGAAHDTLVTFGDLLSVADAASALLALQEVPIGCHEGCAEFVGGEHQPEINPITGGPRWRMECPDCATVISLHDDREDAVHAARRHAVSPAAVRDA